MTSHRPLRCLAAAIALAATAFGAQAASFSTTGQLVYDTDVVRIEVSLATAGAVTLWTDSWLAGLNFDPTLSLFDAAGRLIATGDDTPDLTTAHPGQGGYDGQISLASLAAGTYLLTLSASGNDPVGLLLSDGFSLQGTTPILIADWNQPSYDINKNDQKGSFWEVRAEGVTTLAPVVAAVPEPSGWALMMVGLGASALVVGLRRRAGRG